MKIHVLTLIASELAKTTCATCFTCALGLGWCAEFGAVLYVAKFCMFLVKQIAELGLSFFVKQKAGGSDIKIRAGKPARVFALVSLGGETKRNCLISCELH